MTADHDSLDALLADARSAAHALHRRAVARESFVDRAVERALEGIPSAAANGLPTGGTRASLWVVTTVVGAVLAATSVAVLGEGSADSAHRSESARGVEEARGHEVEIVRSASSGPVPPAAAEVMTPAPTVDSSGVIESSDAAVSPTPTPLASKSAKSAEALLREGNQARRGGEFRSARALYRQLVQRFPRSRQAAMARITLGRIELEHFGRPRAALAQYDAYLASRGPRPLAGEALVGRARAYRRLGQTRREIEAWTRLIESFPDSAHVGRANQRLESLKHR